MFAGSALTAVLSLLFVRLSGAIARTGGLNINAAGQVRDGRMPKLGKETKTALLIHSGILRGYELVWPLWEKHFIKPSEAAGVKFTIAVSTDLGARCDIEAEKHTTKWSANRCACTTHVDDTKCQLLWRSVGEKARASFTREIQAMYGPSSKGGPVEVIHLDTDELLQQRFNTVYTRAMPLLKKYENQTFDYIIVARPDISFVDATNASNIDREFDLVSICNSHPGLNLITGNFVRNDDVHWRDWDWGYMLCDGRHKEDAKAVMFGACGPCYERLEKDSENCVPPARSADFVTQGGDFSCNARGCTWFEGMEGKMRFGTLDDTLFGHWPQDTRFRCLDQIPPSLEDDYFRCLSK